MSIKSFLTIIWGKIKTIFDAFPTELKTAVHIGVLVTENLKKAVDSPGADILTAIIPGDIDNLIKIWLRGQLPKILSQLLLMDTTVDLTDPNAITAAAIKIIQGLDPKISAAFLHNISILVAQVAADGKLSWSDGVLVLEWYYKHEYDTAA